MSIVDDAYRHLRACLTGRFRFEEFEEPLKVVVAPDGRLVASVMVAMLRAFDTVLLLPDDDESSLHLQVTIEELDERGPQGRLCDRWQAYHGPPPDVRWAFLSIDAAKFRGQFIEGGALMRPNPLAQDEAALCREFNGAEEEGAFGLLRRACDAHLPRRLERPVLVGVDPGGFDVRGTFDIYRLESPTDLACADDARRMLRRLAEGASS